MKQRVLDLTHEGIISLKKYDGKVGARIVTVSKKRERTMEHFKAEHLFVAQIIQEVL